MRRAIDAYKSSILRKLVKRRERGCRLGWAGGGGGGQNTDTDMKTDVRTKLKFVELSV
jgi:hypothetical protein